MDIRHVWWNSKRRLPFSWRSGTTNFHFLFPLQQTNGSLPFPFFRWLRLSCVCVCGGGGVCGVCVCLYLYLYLYLCLYLYATVSKENGSLSFVRLLNNTYGIYPFANRLNRLNRLNGHNGLSHLCWNILWTTKHRMGLALPHSPHFRHFHWLTRRKLIDFFHFFW